MARPSTHTLSESDNGRTISVRRGDHIVVVLHSTYWTYAVPSGAVVSAGTPTVAPQMHGCVPGGGCGTVTGEFTAAAVGQATVSAHRDSCGEALACTGGQGDWRVTVDVTI